MDGLLIDTEPHWQVVEKEVLGKVGVKLNDEMQALTLGLRGDEQISFWYRKQPWDNPDFKALERKYNDAMVEYFKTGGAELMEGAVEALNFFSKKGLPLALASSSTMKLINTFLDKFKLHHYFTEVYSAETESHGKPHPAVFLETARRLNTEPVNCLVLEDSFHGMIAAKAARMKTLVVPDKRYITNPMFGAADMKLATLNDLTEEVFHQLNQN